MQLCVAPTWMLDANGDLLTVTGPEARVSQRADGSWQWTTEDATGYASDPFTAMLDAGILRGATHAKG